MTKARRRSRRQPVFRDRRQPPARRRLTVRPRFRLLRIPVRRPDRRHLRPVRTPQRPRVRRLTLHRGRTPKCDRNPLRPVRMPALPPRRLAVRGTLLPGRRMLPRRNALKPVPQGRPMRPHRLFRAAVMSCWECSARRRMRRAPSMRRRKGSFGALRNLPFRDEFMVSPFESADMEACALFVRNYSDRFPGLWTYTAR